jgi:hypothetical protein
MNNLWTNSHAKKGVKYITADIALHGSDKFIIYDRGKVRLDYIAGQVYNDETLTRVIMWANPEYFIEFDIPTGTVIRVPYPINDVLSEITQQLVNYSSQ